MTVWLPARLSGCLYVWSLLLLLLMLLLGAVAVAVAVAVTFRMGLQKESPYMGLDHYVRVYTQLNRVEVYSGLSVHYDVLVHD